MFGCLVSGGSPEGGGTFETATVVLVALEIIVSLMMTADLFKVICCLSLVFSLFHPAFY